MSAEAFGVAGLVGWPVAHSRSPVIHNHWLARYGVAGHYVLFPVPGERLGEALRGMAALGLRGCNVTIPHKEAVMPWLDHIDEAARRIGAVNAIVVQPDGTLAGYNHDGDGFVQSVREEWPQWHPERGPVTVIGAGGAARAVVAALSARGVPEVRVVNRTLARAQTLARDLGGRVKAFPWSRRAELLGDVALLVNCTACGMIGKEELDLALDGLAPDAVVADLIYVPPQTALLARARARGHRTVNGLGMLLHQAQPAFHAWFGVMPAITPELRAAVEATFRPPVSAT